MGPGFCIGSRSRSRTLYDPYNNRWIAVMQTVTTGAGDILLGVSQTSDPNGAWFLYRFAISIAHALRSLQQSLDRGHADRDHRRRRHSAGRLADQRPQWGLVSVSVRDLDRARSTIPTTIAGSRSCRP